MALVQRLISRPMARVVQKQTHGCMGTGYITETALQTIRKKIDLCSKPLSIWTKIKLDLCFKPCTTIHAYWMKYKFDSKKVKTIKHMRRNNKRIYQLWLWITSFSKLIKSPNIKKKVDKFNYIKKKNFCSSKDTIKR